MSNYVRESASLTHARDAADYRRVAFEGAMSRTRYLRGWPSLERESPPEPAQRIGGTLKMPPMRSASGNRLNKRRRAVLRAQFARIT